MTYAKSILAKHLMEQMGVADINSFWRAIPASATLTRVNANIGRHLGTIEDEDRAMRDNLARLGGQQTALLASLDGGGHPDTMWIGHYAAKIAESAAETQRALESVRGLMEVRSLLLAELPPA
jgi:hypothetical protein